MTAKESGRRGEELCAKYLQNKGWTITGRNVHTRYGEIDVIAENETTLAFVEVKTRKEGAMVRPAEAVDLRKMQKIVLTAQQYLLDHPTEKQPRFDVFEVLLPASGGGARVRMLEGAFDASCIDGVYY